MSLNIFACWLDIPARNNVFCVPFFSLPTVYVSPSFIYSGCFSRNSIVLSIISCSVSLFFLLLFLFCSWILNLSTFSYSFSPTLAPPLTLPKLLGILSSRDTLRDISSSTSLALFPFTLTKKSLITESLKFSFLASLIYS